MIFACLVVKSYHGTSKTHQTVLVRSLGAVHHEGTYVWRITAHTPEDIKRVESLLRGRVPYRKELS